MYRNSRARMVIYKDQDRIIFGATLKPLFFHESSSQSARIVVKQLISSLKAVPADFGVIYVRSRATFTML